MISVSLHLIPILNALKRNDVLQQYVTYTEEHYLINAQGSTCEAIAI